MVNGNGSGNGQLNGNGPWSERKKGRKEDAELPMRNNQPNKGSDEAAATRANNQPNNSMEAWSRSVMASGNINGMATESSLSSIEKRQSFRRFELLEFDFMTLE
jgi:hypothetical protein